MAVEEKHVKKCVQDLPINKEAGGLSRDQFGNLLAGFRRKLGTSTSLAAELWAIRDRLQLATNLNLHGKLIVECDSEVAREKIGQ
ncbi:hypothetical protein CCACVL1_03410 [Corchorus capsularis]|uniref:RNase H type-1 domain-containing protein n=1 Tax=Corchorus capsularis TaxID=210143 RepID=A0A1R3JZQ1_COCAP|nr:hypothetical protein CCACVL1_03410 [Corchorus capsularis]